MGNIAADVSRHAQAEASGIALRGGRVELSYGELWHRCSRIAATLGKLGVGRGDRVLLVAPNLPQFVTGLRAIHAVGAVAVTVNTMSTGPELEYVAGDAQCSMALLWETAKEAAQHACGRLGIGTVGLEQALDAGSSTSGLAEPVEVADEETAVLLYTSGTTGRPKGAQVTHGNLAACARIFHEALAITGSDVLGTALPLFHIFGQGVILGVTLRAGATLALLERFDPGEFSSTVARDRVTVAAGVPTMWNALLHSGADPQAFTSLRLAASGGASLPEEVLRAFQERFGCTILEGYGLTETTGAATFNGLHRPRKPGRVGVALEGCEVRVVDDQDAELPAGEVGEVLIRGPVVMNGYWRRPEETESALRNGWLHTGDLGELDEDRDLRIVDRKKDLIIRGGYNVYPREVEEVLFEHPDVIEVGVVGIPDEHYGEEVGAAVVLRPGSDVSMAELRAWAKQRLSAYKVPHRLLVLPELPKGPTGKVLRRAIDRRRLAAATVEQPIMNR